MGQMPSPAAAAALLGTLAATQVGGEAYHTWVSTVDPQALLAPNIVILAWIAYSLVSWWKLIQSRSAGQGGETDGHLSSGHDGQTLGHAGGDASQAYHAFMDGYDFSAREREIVLYVLQGYNSPYIAEKLAISDSTVRSHLRSIYQKAEVASRMELIELFRRRQGEPPATA